MTGSGENWVLHIDMDAFFASCEQLTRPTLRGRPVLVGGTSGRGVVAGASYEARALGARSAMPMMTAKKLVGYSGIIVTPRFPVYSAASRKIMTIIEDSATIVEQLSVDEAFIHVEELQGATEEVVHEWAESLRARIRQETGLPSSVGAGTGKQFAKIASGLAKPDGVTIIPRAQQHRILDPLPVRSMWGIGPVAESKLQEIGVTTIAQFAALSKRDVEMTLGKTVGPALWLIAQGHDDRPVKPRAIAKQISSESTFSADITTAEELRAAIEKSAEKSHRRLVKDGRGARTMTVKLKTADFQQFTKAETIPYSTTSLPTITSIAQRLGTELWGSDRPPLRLVGVSLSGLEQSQQVVLFPELDVSVAATGESNTAGSAARQATSAVAGQTTSTAGEQTTSAAGEHLSELTIQSKLSQTAPQSSTVSAEGTKGTKGTVDAESTKSAEITKNTEGAEHPQWSATVDVHHPTYGHGWVQGSGHGIVTVRFETRTTERPLVKNFPATTDELTLADPLVSLDWDELSPEMPQER